MTATPGTGINDGHPERSADAVMQHLLAGNLRFVTDTCIADRRDRQRREVLAAGQEPFVTIFTCSDSRVAPEVLFDVGLGDVFTVRTAGHVVDDAVLGSLAYGVEMLHTPVVLILGHEACGALGAARTRAAGGPIPDGHIGTLVREILAGFVPSETPTEEFAMLRGHVGNTAARLMDTSVVLRKAVEEGRTTIVGMKYVVGTGEARYVGHAGLLDATGYPVAAA